MKHQRRARHGFTLVEIMIIVAIIGLLAVIAVPNYIRSRSASQKNACVNNLRAIDGAINQWAMEHKQPGSSPVTEPDVIPYLKQGADTLCPAGGTKFSDSYELVDCQTIPRCLKQPGNHIFD